ncbi:MAG: Na+/H+ antiporter subunit E [Phycisphaerae bacterium]
MNLFLLNLFLAVLWCLTWGTLDPYTFLAGFVIGYMVLGLYSRVTAVQGYGRKIWDLIRFFLYFVRILIKANLQIAYEVLTPTHNQRPRIVRYDIGGLTDIQVTTLANLISLTPGTLVMDICNNRRFLYVHCMYGHDRDEAIAGLDEVKHRMLEDIFK